MTKTSYNLTAMRRRKEKKTEVVFKTTLNGKPYEERAFRLSSFKGNGSYGYLAELRERFPTSKGFEVTEELREMA